MKYHPLSRWVSFYVQESCRFSLYNGSVDVNEGESSVSAGAVSAVRRTYSQTKQAIGLRNMGQGALPLAGVGSAHEKKTIAAGNQTPKAYSFPI